MDKFSFLLLTCIDCLLYIYLWTAFWQVDVFPISLSLLFHSSKCCDIVCIFCNFSCLIFIPPRLPRLLTRKNVTISFDCSIMSSLFRHKPVPRCIFFKKFVAISCVFLMWFLGLTDSVSQPIPSTSTQPTPFILQPHSELAQIVLYFIYIHLSIQSIN